jgi:septum formation protein
VTRPLVLASASPARLRLMRDAGLDPVVRISGVDESAVVEADPMVLVQRLATRKAQAVAAELAAAHPSPHVVGCDSMLEVDAKALGKPGSASEAVQRWRTIRGRQGRLLTGHCVIDTGTGGCVERVASTTVRFGHPSDEEIDAYVATGEPLSVAGAFTIDGRGAAFVDGLDGDHSNVIGLSLPLLRALLAELHVGLVDLWR